LALALLETANAGCEAYFPEEWKGRSLLQRLLPTRKYKLEVKRELRLKVDDVGP
jgi:hypothetical protein